MKVLIAMFLLYGLVFGASVPDPNKRSPELDRQLKELRWNFSHRTSEKLAKIKAKHSPEAKSRRARILLRKVLKEIKDRKKKVIAKKKKEKREAEATKQFILEIVKTIAISALL